MLRATTATLTLTLLIGVFLLAGGCNRRSSAQPAAAQPASEPAVVSSPEIARQGAETPAADTLEPQGSTVSEIDLDEEARRRELARREREAAAREAELAERERRLREERQRLAELETATAPTPVPAPAPPAEPAPLPQPVAPPVVAAPEPPRVTIREIPVTVPAGTRLEVEFLQALSSESNQAGDEFRARVLETIEVDGYFAIPAGAEISGVVTEAEALKKIGGRARLSLHFDRLVLPSGEIVPLRAGFAEQGRSETRRDAAAIGGGAAAGAILGRVAKPRDKREGGLIGSILGAAVGAAVAARTQGEPVVIERGERTSLELQDDVRLVVKIRQISS